jgi:signal transduction histidine kinase
VLGDALQEARPLAEARGIRIEEGCDGNTLLKCDRDRIVRVLSNLVGNALKFAPEHGGVITIDCNDRGDDVLFTVADNGPGIRPEELPHVFDIYWQGRQETPLGVGLGLAIVQGIVEGHGGRIWVESVFGEGARFFFTIPCAKADA